MRAGALTELAGAVGGERLVREVRTVLAADPPPVRAEAPDVVGALRATYAAHERAAILIAAGLDRLERSRVRGN
ncbi:MAG: hypothetical protein JO179_09675 [Solirubrobacterales bacterium]|nr:hypothetical protein [Solirubrobacterales bacterium]